MTIALLVFAYIVFIAGIVYTVRTAGAGHKPAPGFHEPRFSPADESTVQGLQSRRKLLLKLTAQLEQDLKSCPAEKRTALLQRLLRAETSLQNIDRKLCRLYDKTA